MADYLKIEIVDEADNILITSQDVRFDQDRMIIFGKNFDYINHEIRVTIKGYTEDGITIMEGIVKLSTNLQVNIEGLNIKENLERRESVKSKAKIYTNVVKTVSTGKNKRIMNILSPIKTIDISMGGLCFVSRTPFFLNQIVYVDLNEVFQGMVLPAKILRKNRVRDGEYRYKYGCQFQRIMSNQERALCEYAFKMQIINKQKKEGEL